MKIINNFKMATAENSSQNKTSQVIDPSRWVLPVADPKTIVYLSNYFRKHLEEVRESESEKGRKPI